ncbi:competence/damage-inducible protein A [Sulfurimonas sp. HSL-3221]|uniref:competence/damage-inducible protein A n=1 Tax=Sulfurimonadaceae TaxID=2771471 RepID=UPI001E3D8EE1|nr:molybdopterin-binding protein [Sulfurimonas sp. HSL-3221]UFS61306.1 competence/damage-inducible protein A [Sulfurimonas sp. HSL-3221]
MNTPNFYAVIIGTEILNGRRSDKHFAFLKEALEPYGHALYASLVIKDDAALIEATYRMILADPDAVLFSFGGIGSTPDDLTRPIAAKVFTDKPLRRHFQFEQDIIERFGDEARPHRVRMADLPVGVTLLKNPVNNMSGFSLENRYFFVPGFPEMAHPMIEAAIKGHFSQPKRLHRRTLIAETSENTLIDVMKKVPEAIEFSSLPMLRDGVARVEISVAGSETPAVDDAFALFTDFLHEAEIAFQIT